MFDWNADTNLWMEVHEKKCEKAKPGKIRFLCMDRPKWEGLLTICYGKGSCKQYKWDHDKNILYLVKDKK